MKRLFSNLTFWVLIAISLGVFIGHFFPDFALMPVLESEWKAKFMGQELKLGKTLAEFLGSGFISIVKLFINPIIFLTITVGLVNMGDLKKVGTVGAKALIYFEVVTTIALIIGIVVANIIRPGDGVIAQSGAADINKYTQQAASFSWLNFLKDNSTIQVLLLALVCGIILNKMKKNDFIMEKLHLASKWVFKALFKVMIFAPIGAFGGMAFTIAKYGIKALLPLGKLMLTVYSTMALFIFVVLYYILKYYKIRLWSFLKYIKEELLIVLGTSSSEAGLPGIMQKLENIGCSKSVVGLVVPAGYSFNLDGTTIYLSMAVIFLAQVYHVQLGWGELLSIIGILMVTSKGAAGVTGSGFVVLASTLTSIKTIPVEGLALLLGVDRFMSEARAITNIIGNGVATIWLSHNEKEFDRTKWDKIPK